jgi:outer membrane lipoprotein SlyB
VAAVLAALGQTAPAALVSAQEEIVIRRDDGSVTSVTAPPHQNFSAGQTVDIITAAQTVLRAD